MPIAIESSQPLDLDEDVLIRRILSGEPDLFEHLITLHEGKVKSILRRYLTSPQDLLDVLQQTWIKAWRNLNQYRGQSSFSTWVVRIAINEALQVYRQSSRSRLVSTEDLDVAHRLGAAASRQRDIVMPFLMDKIEGLPAPYSTALLLHTVYGLTDAEIAASQNISLPAAKSRLCRARTLIRKQWMPRTRPQLNISAAAHP